MHYDYLWQQLHSYAASVEGYIANDRAAIPLPEPQQKELLAKPELELEYDFSYEELLERLEIFPQVLRRSLVVTCWTAVEHQMNDLCGVAANASGARFRVEDLRGAGVVRAATYLKRVLPRDPMAHRAWPYVRRIQELRNVLVHRNGSMEPSEAPKLRDFISAQGRLGLDPAGNGGEIVVVGSGFADELISTVRPFVSWVANAVDALTGDARHAT